MKENVTTVNTDPCETNNSGILAAVRTFRQPSFFDDGDMTRS